MSNVDSIAPADRMTTADSLTLLGRPPRQGLGGYR